VREALNIPSAPHGAAWLFSFDDTIEVLDGFDDKALSAALGIQSPLDMTYVERFDASTIAEYGLAKYLSDANGLTVPAADTAKLNAQQGALLLVFDRAVSEDAQIFAPTDVFTFIGQYAPDAPVPSFDDLESKGAEGLVSIGKPAKSDARISGMIATYVLIFLALFVTVFIWIA